MFRFIKTAFLTLITFLIVISSSPSIVIASPNTTQIVFSDPALNFNSTKLQQDLDQVSVKYSNLNIKFYSNNTLSSNKAVNLNDAFISTIKINNYITLFFNKDIVNVNKGSFSSNVGADFRDFISKETVDKELFPSLRKKYLPQNPEGFIVAMADSIASNINGVKFRSKVFVYVVTLLLTVIFSFILAKIATNVISNIDDLIKEFELTKTKFTQVFNEYIKLTTEFSVIPVNYEGETKEALDKLQAKLNEFGEELETLSTINFKRWYSIISKKVQWTDYIWHIDTLIKDINVFKQDVKTFITNLSTFITSKDPIKDVRLELELLELKLKVAGWKNEIRDSVKANKFLLEDLTFIKAYDLFNNKDTDYSAIQDSYIYLKSFISAEIVNSNKFNTYKNTISNKYSFLIACSHKDYSDFVLPITEEFKQKLTNKNEQLLALSYSCNVYPNILAEFDKQVNTQYVMYKEIDDLFGLFNSTIKDIRSNLNQVTADNGKYYDLKQEYLSRINTLTLTNQNQKATLNALAVLDNSSNNLKSEYSQYKDRVNKVERYSASRQTNLMVYVDNGDWSAFDSRVKTYKQEDTSSNNSSSSYSSSNSSSSSSSSDWSSSSSSSDSSYSDNSGSSSDSSW